MLTIWFGPSVDFLNFPFEGNSLSLYIQENPAIIPKIAPGNPHAIDILLYAARSLHLFRQNITDNGPWQAVRRIQYPLFRRYDVPTRQYRKSERFRQNRL